MKPNTVLRPALPAEREAVKQVYREAFGDPESYISLYFGSQLFLQGEVLALEEAGELQSAFHCLRGPQLQGRELTYLYALGTRNTARGKGYGGAVLRACVEKAAKENAPACICPASESLYRWYTEKLGEKPCFFVRETQFNQEELPEPLEDGQCIPVEGRSYARLRELLLGERPHVQFPDRFWDWQELSCRYGAGGLILLDLGGPVGAAIVQQESETAIAVKELLLPEGNVADAVALLCRFFGCETASVRTPVFWEAPGTVRPFVIACLPEGELFPVDAWWGPVFD